MEDAIVSETRLSNGKFVYRREYFDPAQLAPLPK
jgi:hypothetical protein